jgi:8-amino-7-oxononanoate synthase
MLDFTSALYLGLRHASWLLQPWDQLTTGAPAVLAPPPGAHRIAEMLAALQGCESATLAPSTLHLFWDLFGTLSLRRGVAIYMDTGTYPIARWGIERAAARGVPVRSFPHHDPDALRRQLQQDAHRRWRPLVVADGFCPGCGRPAPIAAYLESARASGGHLILDDTQALGVLGHAPEPDFPYGRGGGGSLRWGEVAGPDVLVGSSLAKGFGVPVAVLAGSSALLQQFVAASETRLHSSPPCVAVIHAAAHALAVNRTRGEALRRRLVQGIRHFRKRLSEAGFAVRGGLFPVQTLMPLPSLDTPLLHDRLLQLGVRTVLRRGHNGSSPCLSFLLTARHTRQDIDAAVGLLAKAAGRVARRIPMPGARADFVRRAASKARRGVFQTSP